MAVVDVGIVLTARDQASATINRVRQSVQSLNGNNGFGGINRTTRSAGSGIQSLLSKFNTISAAAFIVAQSVKTLGIGFLQLSADAQKASLALIVSSGSVAKANEQFTLLVETFGPAGFAVENMTKNFNSLRGAGLGMEDANRTLAATAAAVAAFGGTQQNVDKAVLALSQISSKGVAQMEELRGQLSEAVPIALAIMADKANISIGEMMERVKSGLLSSEEAIRLFTEGAEELFDGLLEAQKNTLTGAVNLLKNSISVGLADVFARTDLDERLTIIVQDMAAAIKGFFDSIDQQAIDDWWATMRNLADTFEPVADGLRLVGEWMGALFSLDFLNWLANITQGFIGLFRLGITYVLIGLTQLFSLMSRMSGNTDYADFLDRVRDNLIAQAKDVENMVANEFTKTFGDRGHDGAPDDPDRMAGIAKSNQLFEETAKRLETLQANQRQWNTESKETLRIQERLADLADATSAQYNGSIIDFIGNLDRVALRMADILDVEAKLIPVRQASLAYYEGMSVEAIRLLAFQAAIDNGASENLASIASNAIGTFLNKMEQWRSKTVRALNQIEKAQAEAFGDLTGDTVASAVAQVNLYYDDQLARLIDIRNEVQEVHDRTGAFQETLEKIDVQLANNLELRQKAVDAARAMAEFAQLEYQAQVRIAGLQAQQQAREIRDQAQGGLGAAINGTQAGQLMDTVAAQRSAMQVTIEETRVKIAQLRAELTSASGAAAQGINDTINQQLEVLAAQTDALGTLSEAAILAQQLWGEVGSVIERSVGDAIYGLITGTQTLADVGRQMFASLTRAAIDYIVQLLIIQAIKMATGLASGGVVPGGSTPVHSGAGGNPRPMASGGSIMGGIISGPTAFLAGEAGKEAIMPLANVGGKLGVRMAGGGGDTYNINISAIDTQSGMQFLIKNMDTITGGLSKSTMLNRGTNRFSP